MVSISCDNDDDVSFQPLVPSAANQNAEKNIEMNTDGSSRDHYVKWDGQNVSHYTALTWIILHSPHLPPT